jgi:hypothetical protein
MTVGEGEGAPQQPATARSRAIERLTWQQAKELQVHRFADWFPKMSGRALKDFKADIDEQTLSQPVLLWRNKDGKPEILDGRHRRDVSVELKRALKVEYFEGTDEEIWAEIKSRNLHRRHLTPKQRADIAAKRVPELRKQAIEQDKDSKESLSSKRAPKGSGDVIKKAAGEMEVSRSAVQRAQKRQGQKIEKRKPTRERERDGEPTEEEFKNKVYKKWSAWLITYPHKERNGVSALMYSWTQWLNDFDASQRWENSDTVRDWIKWLSRFQPQERGQVSELVHGWISGKADEKGGAQCD